MTPRTKTAAGIYAPRCVCDADVTLVAVRVGGGAIAYRFRCLLCLDMGSNPVPHAKVSADTKAALPLLHRIGDEYERIDWNARPLDERAVHFAAKREAEAEAAFFAERQRRVIETDGRDWGEQYDAYLASPTWAAKRRRVLDRAGGVCEGCGERPAVQVHHLHYPRAWPGSPRWTALEKLYDLRALCVECHSDLHLHLKGAAE
jgi:hypothetical protein